MEDLYLDGRKIEVPDDGTLTPAPPRTDPEVDYAILARRIEVEKALLSAHQAEQAFLAQRDKEQEEEEEQTDPIIPLRNMILAGSGEKEKLFGGITKEPEHSRESLESLGFEPTLATQIIAERSRYLSIVESSRP